MNLHINKILFFVICLSSVLSYGQSSPLSTGTWHKIEVNETGVYKLDYSFLSSIGLAGKDPKTIKIFGYGGIVAQGNSDFRYGDIVENNIYVRGEEDGQLNSDDYILFYGQGADIIYENSQNELTHEKNPYDSKSYYFISASEGEGKRISYATNTDDYTKSSSTLPYVTYHEKEENNLIKSGREWVGEAFKFQPERTFNFQLTDLKTDSLVEYEIRYVGGSVLHRTNFHTYINNQFIKTSELTTIRETYGNKGIMSYVKGDLSIPSTSFSVRSVFDNKGDGGAVGYLDYIRVVYHRTLKGNRSTMYTIQEENRASELSISDVSSNTLIWDVSRVNDIKGITPVDGKIKIGASVSNLLILNKGDYKTPSYVGNVKNQNLHQLEVPTLLIVTNKALMESAKAYSDFKNNISNIQTEVVDIDEIYNEYSSGSADISAIRDFVRDLYLRDNKLQYLLLFGDCSYDYQNRISNNENFVPIYQSRSSFNNTTSFSSDDYFGFLEEGEGDWEENSNGKETLEIGIGRLPIRNNEEGYAIRKKIEKYVYDEKSKGNWRNKVVLVADDGDDRLHMKHADSLSALIGRKIVNINYEKIYLDAYEQISSSGGQIAPSVNDELKAKINRGALIINYSGHGSEEQWTQEQILTINQINKLENEYRLPFFITATCEFGRYDDPSLQSGAERLLLNEKGGAIGLMTTTRPVYANSNYTINRSFYDNAFLRNAEGTFDYLGDIQKRTKNESIVGFYNRNFSLLGDPTIKLGYPDYMVSLDSLNGKAVSGLDTIKALQKVSVVGHIQNGYGVKDSGYNGKLVLAVYDKRTEISTLGDKGETPFDFQERSSVIFEGEVQVVNGEYKVEFVTPKDISYAFGQGKMSFYAVNDVGQQATGSFYDFVIGGGLNGFQDDFAPDIEMFVDDSTFMDGGITSRDPLFIANVFDENGINTTNTGIGHEITLVIDDNMSDVHVLNDYYKSVDNTYKKGRVEYPLYNLSVGPHKLTLKVWDVNNNNSEEDLWILVSDQGQIKAYPNPFTESITFQIDQPRTDINGEVEINIYNSLGEMIWDETTTFDSFTSVVESVVWNGESRSGEKMSSGIYFVTTNIRYNDNFGNTTEKTKVVLQN